MASQAECKIAYDGFVFPSSAILFYYLKALCLGDQESAEAMLLVQSNWFSKYMVMTCPARSDPARKQAWTRPLARYVCKLANFLKFSQNPNYKFWLLGTFGQKLVFWDRSPVWGSGTESENDQDQVHVWPGSNDFGTILMEIREMVATGKSMNVLAAQNLQFYDNFFENDSENDQNSETDTTIFLNLPNKSEKAHGACSLEVTIPQNMVSRRAQKQWLRRDGFVSNTCKKNRCKVVNNYVSKNGDLILLLSGRSEYRLGLAKAKIEGKVSQLRTLDGQKETKQRHKTSWLQYSIAVLALIFFGLSGVYANPMICQTHHAGKVWKLPVEQQCSVTPFAGSFSIFSQPLNMYSRSHVQYESMAYKCHVIEQTVETFTWFFNDESRKRQRKRDVSVTPSECARMVKFKQCDHGDMTSEAGIWLTKNKVNWKYMGGGLGNCCHWASWSATNCFLFPTKVYQRHNTQYMESPGGDVGHCSYFEDSCALKDGSVLIWEADPKEKCEFLPWKKVYGDTMGTNWLSRDGNLGLTFKSHLRGVKDCPAGRTLTMSDQGLAVEFLKSSSISENLVPGVAARTKREAEPNDILSQTANNDYQGIVTSDILAASMQGLQADLQNNIRFAYRHAHLNACKNMRRVVQIFGAQLLSSPTVTLRRLLNKTNIYAEAGHDFVIVYPCEELHSSEYTFLPMNASCTKEIPIRFSVKGYSMDGFMNTETSIVKSVGTPVDCKLVENVPLTVGNQTSMYNSQSGSNFADLKCRNAHLFL